jgi:hypothetical protein
LRYRLINGTAAGTSRDNATLNGNNIQLVKEEVTPDSPNSGVLLAPQRVLLDYVVSFNVSAVMDANDGQSGQPRCPWLYDNGNNKSEGDRACDPPATGATFSANQVRTLIIDLSVRTPEQDMNFPWPGGQITELPIERYRPASFIAAQRPGAFRVRTLHAEIFVPNVAYN